MSTGDFTHFLIGPDGESTSAELKNLQERFAVDWPIEELLEFAVRQAGWIEVFGRPTNGKSSGPGLEIRLDCRSVTRKAATKAIDIVKRHAAVPVELSYYLCGAQKETLEDGTKAGLRLSQLGESADLIQPPALSCRAREPDELLEATDPTSRHLAQIYLFWMDKEGHFDTEVIPFLRNSGSLARTLLVEPTPDGNCGIFTYIGEGFTLYGPDWPHQAIGTAVHRQPDRDYGIWAAKAFHVMMASGLPQYEDVTARIRAITGGARHRHYKCLRTPWRTTAGDLVMMTNSFLTPTAPLRLVA